MGAIGQILILLAGGILAFLVFRFLDKREKQQKTNWQSFVKQEGFTIEEAPVFREDEVKKLQNLEFATTGPREILSTQEQKREDGLQILATVMGRRQKNHVKQCFFQYESAFGDMSVKRYGMALLLDSGGSQKTVWKLGCSGKATREGSFSFAEALDRELQKIDWTILRGHADGGYLAGYEVSTESEIIWITAPRARSAKIVLHVMEQMLAARNKTKST
jgi:hypothetical protein